MRISLENGRRLEHHSIRVAYRIRVCNTSNRVSKDAWGDRHPQRKSKSSI